MVYVKNDTLKKLTGSEVIIDIRNVRAEFARRYPGKRLEIRTERAESGTSRYIISGKQNVIFVLLLIPTVVPGIIYLVSKCKGNQFVITSI